MTGQGPSGNDLLSVAEKQLVLSRLGSKIAEEQLRFGGLYDARRVWQWVPRKPSLTPFEKLAGRLVAFWLLRQVWKGRTAC